MVFFYAQLLLGAIQRLIPINGVLASATICVADMFITLIWLISRLNRDVMLVCWCTFSTEQFADHPLVKLQQREQLFNGPGNAKKYVKV